jgi:hypothetical protein
MLLTGAVVFRLVLLMCFKSGKTLYSSHFFQVFLNRPLNAFLIGLQPKHRMFLAIFPLDVAVEIVYHLHDFDHEFAYMVILFAS